MKRADIDYSELPEHIQEGMRLYIEEGVPPGGFLTAVIENNLKESFGRADHINRERLFEIVSWFYNEAPGPCWGSPEKRLAWIEKIRIEGSLNVPNQPETGTV